MKTIQLTSVQKTITSLFLVGSYAYMITFNTLANTLPLNGITTGELSDKLENYFVPYGGTFAIWGLIFLLLLLFVIVETFKIIRGRSDLKRKFYTILSLNMIGNGTWIIAWHYQFFAVSVIIMIGLLFSLIQLRQLVYKKSGNWLSKLTVSIYLAWISVATVANITALLVSMNLEIDPQIQMYLASGMIAIVTILSYYLLVYRTDIAFTMVVIWALYGITQKQPHMEILQPGSFAFYCYLLLLIGVVVVAIVRLKKYFF